MNEKALNKASKDLTDAVEAVFRAAKQADKAAGRIAKRIGSGAQGHGRQVACCAETVQEWANEVLLCDNGHPLSSLEDEDEDEDAPINTAKSVDPVEEERRAQIDAKFKVLHDADTRAGALMYVIERELDKYKIPTEAVLTEYVEARKAADTLRAQLMPA